MTLTSNKFETIKFPIDASLDDILSTAHYANNQWPAIYILTSDTSKDIYIGQTKDIYRRLKEHASDVKKKQLNKVLLITSGSFNTSVTHDYESRLIQCIAAEGIFNVVNGNEGFLEHEYHGKEIKDHDSFSELWETLQKEKIACKSINEITNSDVFKYSPYKALSKDQLRGLIGIMRNLLDEKKNVHLVEGGAGTGKTILAIFLFKLLKTNIEDFNFSSFRDKQREVADILQALKRRYPEPEMALVVPMMSFRNTLKRVFKKIKGLNANMVIGPAEVVRKKYDIVLVDEGHRLRWRFGLGPYFKTFDKACAALNLNKASANELDWLLMQANNLVLLYDEEQMIKPSDIRKMVCDQLRMEKTTSVQVLTSQLRLLGGNDYVEYIRRLLKCEFLPGEKVFTTRNYSFLLFDSFPDFVKEIKTRDNESGLSRMVAGYAWKWASKKNKELFDIEIEGIRLQWNKKTSDWINSPDSLEQVGCIHTTQGYDLNYAGIIFGNEISYNKENDKIFVRPQEYKDRSGKLSVKDPEELLGYILRIYSTLLKRGIRGTYVYACDPDLKAYFARHIKMKRR